MSGQLIAPGFQVAACTSLRLEPAKYRAEVQVIDQAVEDGSM